MKTHIRTVALVAHDAKKAALAEWAHVNHDKLKPCRIFATGTTARKIKERCPELDITALKSGPLGGDQQLGAMIAGGDLDAMIFFTDPMTPLPHDVDVKALTRLSTLYNIPMACNQATADFIISSALFVEGYHREETDYEAYTSREV
ncbi:methylglyoxal synthase [Aestuariispira ectoiniformans]|uniref:methylglyoxal synthase n=1 Tax=Aestuariispira ectoiniformans TaxID=2775080 RepID=UPI00223AAA94|nr:methylglyoxal synthase [Aestuariispira ectoiniformans]